MKSLTLVTGGTRSGKSSLAESIAKDKGEKIVYIATAIAFDQGMKERIKKHKESRPNSWITIECYKNFNDLSVDQSFIQSDTVLLDCITLMVSNLILDSNIDFDNCSIEEINDLEKGVFKELEDLLSVMDNKDVILVTNEVGMGLVPSYKLGNIFRDIAGRVNQHIAKKSDTVYLTVSGIPIKIKESL